MYNQSPGYGYNNGPPQGQYGYGGGSPGFPQPGPPQGYGGYGTPPPQQNYGGYPQQQQQQWQPQAQPPQQKGVCWVLTRIRIADVIAFTTLVGLFGGLFGRSNSQQQQPQYAQQPMYQQAPARQSGGGMGMGGALALGMSRFHVDDNFHLTLVFLGGAGLLGGALIGNAISDHENEERQEAYQDGM